MRKFFTGLKPIYQIVALDLLAGVVINAVLQSDILNASKISLSVIIGVVAGIAIIAIYRKSMLQEQEAMTERMDERFERYFTALKELADQTDEQSQKHIAQLESQIAALKESAAAFPLAVAKDFTVFAVARKGYQPFYDSDWIISGEFNHELFACHITRGPDETAESLTALIKQTASPDGVWALDRYDEIYPEEVPAA